MSKQEQRLEAMSVLMTLLGRDRRQSAEFVTRLNKSELAAVSSFHGRMGELRAELVEVLDGISQRIEQEAMGVW